MASQSAVSSQHSDLITSVRFSLNHRLATSSLDHTIRVTERNPTTGAYDSRPAEWKAHDSPVLDLAWAEPEFGTILASGAVDGLVKIWAWDQVKAPAGTNPASSSTSVPGGGGTINAASAGSNKRWIQRAVLTDARGTIRSIEFCLAAFGLKLAAVSSDSHLRVWECLDPVTLSEWSLVNDIDLTILPAGPSTAQSISSGTPGASLGTSTAGSSTINLPSSFGATSTTSGSSNDPPNPSGSLTTGFDTSASPNKAGLGAGAGTAGGLGASNAATSSMGSSASGSSFEGRKGGTIETDGGWALSWCREAWWGERLAVSSGTSGIIRLFHVPDHSPWSNFLNLIPTRSTSSPSSLPPTSSLSWAPASGRSYQLLASGSRDGRARVWKIYPPSLEGGDEMALSMGEWRGEMDAELDDSPNKSSGARGGVGAIKVEWNVTGTVLSTAGDDARVRLWKSTYTGQWRTIAVLSTEDAGDEDMEK